jgi:hypothetical protein
MSILLAPDVHANRAPPDIASLKECLALGNIALLL